MTASAAHSDRPSDQWSGVNERKARANAENARHSTGPRTSEGKRSSSMNALKHGAHATRSFAITSGPFAENAEEVDAFTSALVEALAPRDALEEQEAQRIALLYLRDRRSASYEAAMMSHPVRVVHGSGSLEESLASARACVEWLCTGSEDGVDFEGILREMRDMCRNTLAFVAAVERLPCNTQKMPAPFEAEPKSNLWLSPQARVEWHIDNAFGGRLETRTWAVELHGNLEKKIYERDANVCAVARTL